MKVKTRYGFAAWWRAMKWWAERRRWRTLARTARGGHVTSENCASCGHEWRRHDPEDGKCDAGMPLAIGMPSWSGKSAFGLPCPCGRDLAYTRYRNAEMSKDALARFDFGEDA
jgi:hypothetical protein